MKGRGRQAGISIVEILVALAVGLFLTAGVIQLFVNSKQTYRAEDALARVQENARFAVRMLSHDLRMTGNLGCRSLKLAEIFEVEGLTSPVAANLPVAVRSDTVLGYEYESDAYTTLKTSLDTGMSWADNSDVIQVFGVLEKGVYVTSEMTNVDCDGVVRRDDDLVVGSSNLSISAGDTLLITDCEGADLFCASSVAGTTVEHGLTHGADNDSCNSSAKLSRAYNYPGDSANGIAGTAIRAMVFPFSFKTYFVGQKKVAGVVVEQSLYVIEDGGTPQPLVDGVESLNVTWGEDTDADPDKIPDVYRDADDVAHWDRVYSARIDLLLRSDDNVATETQAEGDKRLRLRFTNTVSLRSRMS